jgi:hypothetical protein
MCDISADVLVLEVVNKPQFTTFTSCRSEVCGRHLDAVRRDDHGPPRTTATGFSRKIDVCFAYDEETRHCWSTEEMVHNCESLTQQKEKCHELHGEKGEHCMIATLEEKR